MVNQYCVIRWLYSRDSHVAYSGAFRAPGSVSDFERRCSKETPNRSRSQCAYVSVTRLVTQAAHGEDRLIESQVLSLKTSLQRDRVGR